MKKRIAIGLAVMAMAATAVQAATIRSVPAGGLWSASTTWALGAVPGVTVGGADAVFVNSNSTVTLNSSVLQPLGNIHVAQQGAAGTLIINSGGSLTTGAGKDINAGNNAVGTFTMNGGNVTNGGNFNIANSATAGGSKATITGGTMTNLNIYVGKNANGSLSVTGGQLLGSALFVGDVGIGTFTNSGTVINSGAFNIANSATAGGSTATITGGTMTNKNINVGKAANGSLSVTGGQLLGSSLNMGDTNNLFNGSAALTGGTIEITNALTINTASKLTIGDTGELIWNGDKVANIGTLVTSGSIIWSSGSSTLGTTYGLGDQTWTNGAYFLHADYDATDLKTRVWADTIPEPATIGMIGLGALITLLIRRFSGR